MVLADHLKHFLLHLEIYVVYEKEHEVGHCHQLCLQLVFCCCQYIEQKLKNNVKPLISQFLQPYN